MSSAQDTSAAPTAIARLRATVDRVLHHPVTELALVALILLSVGLLVAEAIFDRDAPLVATLERSGDLVTGLFVVELVARYWVAPKKSRFFRRYWVDLLAVVPLARPLRLFRVLRLLRLFRAGVLINRRASAFQGVFRGAATELTLLGTVSAILVLTGSVTLYLGERATNPDFASFGDSAWFSVLSLVGGEPIGGEPTTELGRAVTLALMLGGLTVFGVFVGTVSASMMARLSKRMGMHEMDTDELSGHVVVCGWNSSGHTMLEELFFDPHAAPMPVVIVTEADELPSDLDPSRLRRELLHHVSGDYTRIEVLERAGIARASAAILLSDQTVASRSDQDRDARTVLAGLTIERLARGIFTCAQLNDRQNESLLRMAGVEEIVVTREYAGFILGSAGRNLGLVTVLDDLLTARHGNAFFKTTLPAALDGRSVGELHTILAEQHGAVLIAVETERGARPQVNPPPATRVTTGAQLVVIAERPPRW